MYYEIQRPTRTKKKWSVVGYLDGRLSGDRWFCDDEFIAKEVCRILRAGEDASWLASYVRQEDES